MTKEFLDNIENTNKELESLKKRLAKIENKECTVVKDSVQGSSKSYPYIKHNRVIEGVEIPKNKNLKHKYKKMIKSKKYNLEKLRLQLEYELNYVKEAEIRDIIRYRYNDNKTWLQIMFLMNYNSESTAKMKLERFLKK
jgi:4-hydroxy-3-methylbut-2-en-1-yl diphosphate synthase IspG/GcpE